MFPAGSVATLHAPLEAVSVAPRRPSVPMLQDVSVSCRPRAGFVEVRQRLERPGALPMLRADFALADFCATGDWCPDPDDLEWDMIDVGRLRAVFAGQGVDLPLKWAADMALTEALALEEHGTTAS